MKKTNDIDQLFQAKLQNHTVTPPPAVWNKLEKELAKKQTKKRQGGIYWQAAAGIAVAVGVTLVVWQQQQQSQPEPTIAVLQPKNTIVVPQKSTIIESPTTVHQNNIVQAQENKVIIAKVATEQVIQPRITKANLPKQQKGQEKTTTVQSVVVETTTKQQEGIAQNTPKEEHSLVEQLPVTTNEITDNTAENTAIASTQITDNVEIIVKIMPSPK
ncbi:MAG: hypothetical protein ACOVQA_02765, partial [Thermoflexibacteraceae bacterium]